MEKNKCYCSLRQKDPNYYSNKGIPDGFCALCDICKKPGHTTHVPAGLPYTGGWCDEHYALIEAAFSPNFEEGKLKEYFQGLDNKKENSYYSEVIGGMLFRAVIRKNDKLIRYKHGSVKFGVEAWIVPVEAWIIPPSERIREDEFIRLWEEAIEPE